MGTLSPLSYKLLCIHYPFCCIVIIFGYYHYLHQRGFDSKRAQAPSPPLPRYFGSKRKKISAALNGHSVFPSKSLCTLSEYCYSFWQNYHYLHQRGFGSKRSPSFSPSPLPSPRLQENNFSSIPVKSHKAINTGMNIEQGMT
jgi:hypothetical protein